MSRLVSIYVDSVTGDVELDEHKRLRMVDDNDACKQRLRLRLGTRLGEWFVDNRFGVPWMELMEKGVDEQLIENEIRKALLADEEVLRVDSLLISRQPNRALHIDFEVTLHGGERIAEEVDVQ